jgi:hypothetical protein
MSPVVQDGRRGRGVYEVGMIGEPSGPVSRRVASEEERHGFTTRRPAGGLPGPVAIATRFAAPSTPAEPEEEEPPMPEPSSTPEPAADPRLAVDSLVTEVVAKPSADHASAIPEADPEPAAAPPDTTRVIRELAAAANLADEAWDEYRAAEIAMIRADERWELARRDLRRAWEALDGEIDLGPIGAAAGLTPLPDPAPDPSAHDVVELGEAIAADLPGVEEVLAGEAASNEHTDIPEIIPVAAPKSAAGGGPGTLGRQQRRILDATIKYDGDRKAAARELGTTDNNIQATLHNIGKKGLLPLGLIGKLPAAFAKYTGV